MIAAPYSRIPAAVVHVYTTEHVKLDSQVKGFVAYVFLDSPEQTVKVRACNNFYCTFGLNHAFKERSALGP